MYEKKTWARQAISDPCLELISSHQQGILTDCIVHHGLVYIRKVHQNTSGSAVSELMSSSTTSLPT